MLDNGLCYDTPYMYTMHCDHFYPSLLPVVSFPLFTFHLLPVSPLTSCPFFIICEPNSFIRFAYIWVRGDSQKRECLTSGYITTENVSLHQQPLMTSRSSWVPIAWLDVDRLHLVQVILAAVSWREQKSCDQKVAFYNIPPHPSALVLLSSDPWRGRQRCLM